MPRNTQNIYQLPPQSYGVTGQIISSVQYNTFLDDIAAELNRPRPISVGGTNATTISGAQEALQVPSLDSFNALQATVTGIGDDKLDIAGGTLTGAVSGPRAQFTSATNTTLNSTQHGLTVGANDTNNIAVSGFRIQARNNGSASTLALNPNGGTVTVNNGEVWHTGNLNPASFLMTNGVASSASALETQRNFSLAGPVTAATVGFDGTGNVILNTAIADDALTIPMTAGLQTALDAKAPLASPNLTGTPTAPTAQAGTTSTQIATTAFVAAAVSNSGGGDMLRSVYDPNNDGVVNSATEATRLAAGRTFRIVGPVVASPQTFDGSQNITLTTSIANNALAIANTSGLQAALDDKLPLSGGTMSGNLITPRIRLTSTNDLSLTSTNHPFQSGDTDGRNIVIDGNEIMARNNGGTSSLILNEAGGAVSINGFTAWHFGNFDPSTKQDTLNADQIRSITVSEDPPSGGNNGDIWLQY